MNITLGALAPKLKNQINVSEKYQEKIIQLFQRDSDAITRLLIRGLLTEKEGEMARKRLYTKIKNEFSGDSAT